MMENNDHLFDDYLHDRLDEPRLREFEERLRSDKTFRMEFEAHKLVLGAFYARRDKELLSRIAGTRARMAEPYQSVRLKKKRRRKITEPAGLSDVKKSKRIVRLIEEAGEKELQVDKMVKKRRRLRPVHYWSMAAGVLLIAVAVWLMPFGSEEVLISKGKIRKVPVLVTTEALGFSSAVDSLDVQVNRIKGPPRYEFFDVLKLYLPGRLSGEKIRITYYEDARRYELTLDGKKYRINKFGSGRLK